MSIMCVDIGLPAGEQDHGANRGEVVGVRREGAGMYAHEAREHRVAGEVSMPPPTNGPSPNLANLSRKALNALSSQHSVHSQ
eukprot:1197385-Rhodomonas_salina.2